MMFWLENICLCWLLFILSQYQRILQVANVLNSLLKGNVLWLFREDEIIEFCNKIYLYYRNPSKARLFVYWWEISSSKLTLPLRKAFKSRIQFEEMYSNHSGPLFSYLLNEANMPYQPHKVALKCYAIYETAFINSKMGAVIIIK